MSYGVGLRNGVAFALGTIPSLTSGGGLRPSLLLDFLSGSLDPRVTFSRGTQAMRYGSDGTLQYAPNNLLTYSNQADNAAWTKSNSFVQTNLLLQSQTFNTTWTTSATTVNPNVTTAPDGTVTADEIVCSANALAYIAQGLSSFSVYSSTLSVYLKLSGADRGAIITVQDDTDGVDISSLTIPSLASGGTDAGNGWRRYSVTGLTPTPGNVASVRIYVDKNGTGVSGVSRLYAWGAQLVQGSVPGDYVATTSAALPVLYADYNGALRARKLCETTAVTTQHAVISSSLGVPAAAVTLSVRAKAGERTLMGLYANTIGKGQYFNLANGTVGAALISAPYSASITPLQNGWYLCTVTVIAGSNEGLSVYLTDGSTITYTGDGSSGIYIADAQLTPGYLPLAVTETTSAAVYGPRFDYDPVTKVARGLLIEEQRANLLLQSNDFQTSWSPTNITRTLNSTLSPEGVVNGVKIEATAAAGTVLYQQVNVAATSATFSVYVKQGTGATTANSFIIRNITTLTNLITGTLNYSTGVYTYTLGSSGVVVSNVGNGWWRIAMTATAGITAGDLIAGYVGFSGIVPAAGDFLYAYGAQLEAGAFATSYIPTVGSTATRNADSASITTLTPWFNAAAGTMYVEGFANAASPANMYLATFNDTTTSNRITLFKATSGFANSRFTSGGVATSAIAPSVNIAGVISKVAFAYSLATNGVNIFVNGTAGTAATASASPTGISRLGIGQDETASAFYYNGWFRSIRFYPTRLPDASAQSITA